MAHYRVRYSRRADLFHSGVVHGSLTVTDSEVQLETRISIGSQQLRMYVGVGGALVVCGMLPLSLLMRGVFAESISPSFMRTVLFWGLWSWMIGSLISLIAAALPLRRRQEVIQRDAILHSEVQARELYVHSETRDFIVTTRTVADAQALADALRDRPAVPITRSICVGQESLFDASGFSEYCPVRVTVQAGVVTLHGVAHAGMGELFAVFGMWRHRPIMERKLPCAELQAVVAIDKFVTFLVPDVKLGERRYTLKSSNSEKASTLARHLQGGCRMSLQMECRPSIEDETDPDAMLHLRRPLPGPPIYPGHVLVGSQSVTFIDRAGFGHPWAWRIASLGTLLLCLVLLVIAEYAHVFQIFGAGTRFKIAECAIFGLAAYCVYEPAAKRLTYLLSTRLTVQRRHITFVSRVGRQISLAIVSTIRTQRLILTTESDGAAKALVRELSRR